MLITVTPDVDYRSMKESPSPEEFFLLSRLRGEVTVAHLCTISGLEKAKAKSMIAKLIDFGLISTNQIQQPFSDNPMATGPVALPKGTFSETLEDPVRSISEAFLEGNRNPNVSVASGRIGAASTRLVEDSDPVEADPLEEPVRKERISINDMFNTGHEEISLNISEAGEVSFDLLKADSKVIEIADDNWADDDDDDMFGGDDEPLGDVPSMSAFQDHLSERSVPGMEVALESEAASNALSGGLSEPTESGSPRASVLQESEMARLEVDFDGLNGSLDTFVSPYERVSSVEDEQQLRVDFVFSQLESITYYQLFNLSPDSDRKAIRTAYFAFSKYFHPDSFFGEKNAVAQRCEKVFKFSSKAYDTLSRKKNKKAYDAALNEHLESVRQQEEQSKIKRQNAQKALLLKVDQLANSGNFEQALIEIRRVIGLEPTRDVLLQGANLHLRANARLGDAAGYVRMILKANKSDVEALVLLGRIYEQNEMFDDAIKLLDRALKIKPADPSLKIHLDRLKSLKDKGSK